MGGFLARYYRRATGLETWTSGAVYQLERCLRCGLIFQRYVGDDALLTELYDHWLSAGKAPDADLDFLAQLAAPAQSRDGHEVMMVSAALGRPLPELRVLDYGMGWGLWALIAQALGAQAYGYDLAASRRAYVAARGVHAVEDVAEIAGLDLDFVNSEQVFEHLAEPLEVMRLLANGLRSGGVLKVSVPQSPGLEKRASALDWDGPLTPSMTAIHPLEHVNCFSPHSLSALASRAGLEPMRLPRRAYLGFLKQPGALPWTEPKRVVKAFARPLYHRFSRTNLYAWFRKP